MPDVVQNITFRTKAELAGANQVLDNLDKQIGKAKAAGKDFAELEKQRAALQQSIANTKFEEPEEAGGHGGGTKGLVQNLKELKKEAHDIPYVGAVIGALRHPIALAGIGLGLFIEGMVKLHEKMKELAADQQLENKLKSAGTSFENVAKESDRAKEAMVEAFQKSGEEARGAADSYNEIVEAISRLANASKEQLKLDTEIAKQRAALEYAQTGDKSKYDATIQAIEESNRAKEKAITHDERMAKAAAAKQDAEVKEAAAYQALIEAEFKAAEAKEAKLKVAQKELDFEAAKQRLEEKKKELGVGSIEEAQAQEASARNSYLNPSISDMMPTAYYMYKADMLRTGIASLQALQGNKDIREDLLKRAQRGEKLTEEEMNQLSGQAKTLQGEAIKQERTARRIYAAESEIQSNEDLMERKRQEAERTKAAVDSAKALQAILTHFQQSQ